MAMIILTDEKLLLLLEHPAINKSEVSRMAYPDQDPVNAVKRVQQQINRERFPKSAKKSLSGAFSELYWLMSSDEDVFLETNAERFLFLIEEGFNALSLEHPLDVLAIEGVFSRMKRLLLKQPAANEEVF